MRLTLTKIRELRLMQLYMWNIVTSKDINGRRTSLLARHGSYEVRLVEPPTDSQSDTRPLWIELYDHDANRSLDSYAGHDFEEAEGAAQKLILRAKSLHQASIHHQKRRGS